MAVQPIIKTFRYSIKELIPYINWSYFYHFWQIPDSAAQKADTDEQWSTLQKDIDTILEELGQHYAVRSRVGLFEANSDGDDILIYHHESPTVLPCLRQQDKKESNSPNLCLSDFIMPQKMGQRDHIGIFACTVEHGMEEHYAAESVYHLLGQSLCIRLVEAAAEKLHEEVRKKLWGYAPDESLSMEDLFHEKFQGIRPAIGYPSLPDHTINFIADELIDMKSLGITFSESGAMMPRASVSGLMLAHPQARYFNLRIGPDQLADYARRRQLPLAMLKKFLATHLIA